LFKSLAEQERHALGCVATRRQDCDKAAGAVT